MRYVDLGPSVPRYCVIAISAMLVRCSAAPNAAMPIIAASAPPMACPPDSQWTSPKPLRSEDGRLWSISRPTGAAVRGGTLLIGSPALKWDLASRARSTDTASTETIRGAPWAGVILRPDGKARPVSFPPNTSIRWMAPLALPAGDSAVDVIWGTHPDSANLSSFIATALWYARFDGIEWTSPQRIAEADAIWWDGSTNAAIRVDKNLHVVTRAYDNTHGARPWIGAIYLRRSSGQWTATPIDPPDFFPRYTALLARDALHVRLIYTGRVREGASVELNGLASIESPDGGSTWGAPSVIRHLSGRAGYWLQADHNYSGYSLTWATLADSDTGASHISDLTSSDGQHWNDTPDLVVQGPLVGFVRVPQPNDYRIVVQSIGGILHSTEWHRGTWQPLTRITSEAVAMAAVTAPDGGPILLTWSEMRPSELPNATDRLPVLMTSELRECAVRELPRRSPKL